MQNSQKGFFKITLLLGVLVLVFIGSSYYKNKFKTLEQSKNGVEMESQESSESSLNGTYGTNGSFEDLAMKEELYESEDDDTNEKDNSALFTPPLSLTPTNGDKALEAFIEDNINPGVYLEDGFVVVEVSEADLNSMIQQNLHSTPQDVGTLQSMRIDVKDGSSVITADWEEGISLNATIAPASDAKSLVITNIDISGGGIFSSILEGISKDLLENMLNGFTSNGDQKVESIQMQENLLVIKYKSS